MPPEIFLRCKIDPDDYFQGIWGRIQEIPVPLVDFQMGGTLHPDLSDVVLIEDYYPLLLRSRIIMHGAPFPLFPQTGTFTSRNRGMKLFMTWSYFLVWLLPTPLCKQTLLQPAMLPLTSRTRGVLLLLVGHFPSLPSYPPSTSSRLPPGVPPPGFPPGGRTPSPHLLCVPHP